MITEDQLKQFVPVLKGTTEDPYADLLTALNTAIDKFGLNTPRRVRYFMAQAYFESAAFMHFEENLNYSNPDRLVAVWPTRFTLDSTDTVKAYAPDYVNKPDMLANLVYANRNGNGNPDSGDGFAYRGRGIFGLTFKANYAQYSTYVYGDDRVVKNPDMVSQYEDGVMSAGWFWSTRLLNELADSDSFTQVTVLINGSNNTVADRILVLNKANLIF